jgi:hypothetical protein
MLVMCMATTRARGRERGQPPDPECAPRVRRRTNDARRSSIEANKREAGPFSKVANFPLGPTSYGSSVTKNFLKTKKQPPVFSKLKTFREGGAEYG